MTALAVTSTKWPRLDPITGKLICRHCWNTQHQLCEGICTCLCDGQFKEDEETE